MNQIYYDLKDYDLLEFLYYINKQHSGLPSIIRQGLIDLLVDSESDVLEHSSRTELEYIVKHGSNIIGINNFNTERVIQCCFEEDIPNKYPGELDGIIRSGIPNIEYTKLLKQWMEVKNESRINSVS